MPVKLTRKGRAFYEKVVWLKIQKPCSLGSTARGTDRRLDRGEISGSSESGPAVEKKLMEGASEIFQSKAERKESKPYTEDDLMKKIRRLEIEIVSKR